MQVDDILETYAAVIARMAASYAPPGAEREDLEQEIALAVMKAAPRFRGDASFKTYVYRIAQNCGIDAIKRRRQASEVLHDKVLEDERHPTTEPGPEQAALKSEQRERLAAGIRTLPLSMRQPLVLRLEGLSYEEIAAILDLTTTTVGVRLHRATAALKRHMGRTS